MTSDKWDLIRNWNLVLPPSRPSASQLRTITSAIAQVNRRSHVAVLGSTPEFRDLLYEDGFEHVFIFDRNIRFYEAMSSARIYRNDEEFVSGDWLSTLAHGTEKFSIILSDLTSGNLPYENRSSFYALVARALSKGGLFIDKVLTHPIPHIPLEQLFKKYAQLPLNLLHINSFSCEVLFCSELLDTKEVVDTSAFYDFLSRATSNSRVLAFAKHAELITPRDCTWWYGRKWDDLFLDYTRDLNVLATHDDDLESSYFGRAKLIISERRR